MSARDVMAAMLDELMGPKRNVELGDDMKVTFDDPNICPYYLVGFCPHEMFVNTKADLGACLLVHDDNLRRMYPESPEYGQLGFEKRLLRFLVQLDEDNLRRMGKNKDKLEKRAAAAADSSDSIDNRESSDRRVDRRRVDRSRSPHRTSRDSRDSRESRDSSRRDSPRRDHRRHRDDRGGYDHRDRRHHHRDHRDRRY
ncbi:hypothetical protein CRE_22117 [Caenorhabditis remanei]|uniref:Uncharacterized protein n=1 Tax=Caenorhabditis remanei TaxID=31234 RepID=E3NFL3_CAERE|nr:hypothetical protein CRE_22117 [Caenorhabditis remanei]